MRRGRTEGEQIDLIRSLASELLTDGSAVYVLAPLRCSVPRCGNIAAAIDVFAPFMDEQNRCRKHAAESPPSTTAQRETEKEQK